MISEERFIVSTAKSHNNNPTLSDDNDSTATEIISDFLQLHFLDKLSSTIWEVLHPCVNNEQKKSMLAPGAEVDYLFQFGISESFVVVKELV